ncbi:MAG: SMC family ATPase [Actinomycetota bacterium]|nr:SMC family ATPase [Actinomycetota bacterium]
MRPLRLELTGFRSHRDTTVIDFSGRRLLAIVGPIGAGKSSIIDAICFALYGKTPKLQKEPRRLICSHSESAHVRLRFSVDGAEYESERLVPSNGTGEHLLTDLASGARTTGLAPVNDAIEELLGLSFKAFCSSIVLAQGQFDEFLHATPDQRTKILKGVFRFDQITSLQHAARSRAGDIKVQFEGVSGELRGLGESLAERLQAARESASLLSEKVERMRAVLPQEQRIETELRDATEVTARARQQEAAAERITAQLPSHNELQSLVVQESRALEDLAALEQALGTTERARTAAEEAVVSLRGKLGDETTLRAARGKAADLSALAEERSALEEEHQQLRDAAAVAAEEVAKKNETESAAENELSETRKRLAQGERADMSHALKMHLKAGEKCPVCQQRVEKPPPIGRKPALDALLKREAAASAALAAARREAKDSAERERDSRAHLDVCTKELARLTPRIGRLAADLEEGLGIVDDPLSEADRRLQQVDRASIALELATTDFEQLSIRRQEALASREGVARKQRIAAGRLISLATQAGVEAPDVDCSADQLVECAAETRRSLQTAIAASREALKAAEATVSSAGAALAELRAAFGLQPSSRIDSAVAAAQADLKNAANGIADLEKKVRRSDELNEEGQRLTARLRIFQQLVDDLRDTKFVDFLLEERRRLLSELGSECLYEMTERYRFSDDAEFDIIDEMATGERRDSETLSGGETFLASLALSLALAEAVTREGGRLESFFLDEGFGSLDADSFEHALDGIERIVMEERLIGLVSHVPALAARVEDKIVLDRTDEGLTVVVSGASA